MNFASEEQKQENIVSIAALMLHDDGVDLSAENISAVVSASGNKVEAYWPVLFSKMLKGQDVPALLASGGGGAAGGAAAGGAAAGGGDAGAAAGGDDKKADAPAEE